MRLRFFLSCAAVLGFLDAGTAEACELTDFAPTGVIPTSPSQPFSFVATNDCAMLSFRAMSGAIVKTPRPGMRMGPDRRRYTVSLTAPEWNSIATSDEVYFSWTIQARLAGAYTYHTTRNQLDFDADGWTRSEGDEAACDLDDARNPGATEICENGIDDDCNGVVDQCLVSLDNADLEVVNGDESGDYGVGTAVSVADFDADGVADLLLGDPYESSAHVMYGPLDGLVEARTGSQLRAQVTGGRFGTGVAAGDGNGDGFADALVGAPGGPLDSAYLFLGPITGSRDTRTADATFVASTSPRDDYLGVVASIGSDPDGDGQPDIVVAATEYGSDHVGAVFVVPGDTLGMAEVESAASATYLGVRRVDGLGQGIQSVGDWNGDGVDELALSGTATGGVYVVDGGGPAGTFVVSDAASAVIGDFHGAGSARSYFGVGLEAADYDGDGTMDLFVGHSNATDDTGASVGAVLSFLGPLTGDVAESEADTRWEADAAVGLFGRSLAVSDVDGDHEPDVLISAGTAYLQRGRVTGTVSAESLLRFGDPNDSFALYQGVVATISDWSGDGADELLFGAPYADVDATGEVGAVYVFFSDLLF
jgi:hypothetical protein